MAWQDSGVENSRRQYKGEENDSAHPNDPRQQQQRINDMEASQAINSKWFARHGLFVAAAMLIGPTLPLVVELQRLWVV